MELPLGGPALRHYTQSRPRPHRQKLNYRPGRAQETIIESENEVLELIGRVDEGVEEFFTKRVLPTDTEQAPDEEPESITVDEVVPATSVPCVPCPPPTKTLRRKLGDFFTLRKRRGVKSETGHESRPKKASIADLIRPLREAARAEKEKDKDKVKEQDKENEKEKGKEQPGGVSAEATAQETPASDAPALRGEVAPPRRALREGKSQSLILLSGSAAGSANARKKQFEGQHSFEQKLHLMLQRIGVSKAQPEETQNPEREMKKAESEGTIIDNKAEPTPTFAKHRTMSASSDTRRQIRPSMSAHESAGKPALPPKPVLKSGLGPSTSGRNTPENDLVQIAEGETSTPTKEKSPTAAPSGPSTPAEMSSATLQLADVTISTSQPDVLTTNTMPANGGEYDEKASDPEAQSISSEPHASSTQSVLNGPPNALPCTSPDSPSPSAASDSTTVTSISALATLSSKISESEANMAVKPTSPVSNGLVSVSEVAISVSCSEEASPPVPMQTGDIKSDPATSPPTLTVEDFGAASPIGTKSTDVAPSSTPPESDSSITSSPTLPPTSTTSTPTTRSMDCVESSPPILLSTSSKETKLTESTTATSANEVALMTPDAISSDPLSSKKTISIVTSATTAPGDSGVTRQGLVVARESPSQDLQTNLDEKSSPTVKDADMKATLVQKPKRDEESANGEAMADCKEGEHCQKKAAQDDVDEAAKKEAREANVEAEDITTASEEGATQPAPEKEFPNKAEINK
ncbi:uncharacterized protein LOC144067046 [Stigmatopora argus]